MFYEKWVTLLLCAGFRLRNYCAVEPAELLPWYPTENGQPCRVGWLWAWDGSFSFEKTEDRAVLLQQKVLRERLGGYAGDGG